MWYGGGKIVRYTFCADVRVAKYTGGNMEQCKSNLCIWNRPQAMAVHACVCSYVKNDNVNMCVVSMCVYVCV